MTYTDEWQREHGVGHPYKDRPHHGGGVHGWASDQEAAAWREVGRLRLVIKSMGICPDCGEPLSRTGCGHLAGSDD